MSEFAVGEMMTLLPARLQSAQTLDTLSHEAMGEVFILGHMTNDSCYIEHTFLIVSKYLFKRMLFAISKKRGLELSSEWQI